MKILVQRVKKAACLVDGKPTGEIGNGFVLFVSFKQGDDASLIPYMAKKVANLRIFEDEAGKMNISLIDKGYSVLSISQFTLEAKTAKGNRPSFTEALDPKEADVLYNQFNDALSEKGIHVEEGVFQKHMDIQLTNDGPVTIMIERTNDND